MPSTIFLKKFREKKFNPFDAWILFKEKSIFLSEILDIKDV